MAKRVYVHYDSHRYTIAGRSIDDVQKEIDAVLEEGRSVWLEVNYGEGRPSLARIMIARGVPIALHQDIESEE
ncbi:hypothetical protein [Naasia sp. SYSU D00948]|uniref:hypothetical protein n=1 Tax=Naasia sp. SYSU D00948 TaxID=2817379 RepID=UPI001B317CC6|nr:hypothetical protein [Naasia sp. SYSU D00948]